uniref:Restriction endonuclease S subunit n=1 Tax=Candidatus Kentrum sp. DK TaxID=2126562 RepID=A0A450S5B6_9GAMM|nr:MAG: Restriction endonuclease S subunit [Candidatus Kentron sp. DK]
MAPLVTSNSRKNGHDSSLPRYDIFCRTISHERRRPIMDTRSTVPLSNLMDIKHGYAFSSRYFTKTPTEYILLTPGNFSKERGLSFGSNTTYYEGPVSEEFILNDGDLLIVMTDLRKNMAILGRTAILHRDGSNKRILHNQRIGKVTPKAGRADPEYLMHLLNSPAARKEIKATATGTTVRHTSPGKILDVEAWAPAIPEQKKIADLLSRWDRLIESTGRLMDACRERRRALAQGLLSGRLRFPEFVRATAVRKRSETAPYSLPCPIDWDYPCIGEIAHPVSKRNKDADAASEPLPILSCTKDRGLVDSARHFGGKTLARDRSSYKIVRRGQFAYATNHLEEGSLGYQDRYEKALISPMYTIFETSGQIVDEFLYLVLKTERYRHAFAVNTNASVNRRGRIRWQEFARIKVPMPPMAEQRGIVRAFSAIDREIELLHEQKTALDRQKEALMGKLLTGRWRIPMFGPN